MGYITSCSKDVHRSGGILVLCATRRPTGEPLTGCRRAGSLVSVSALRCGASVGDDEIACSVFSAPAGGGKASTPARPRWGQEGPTPARSQA